MDDKNLKWIRDIRDKNYELTKDMTEEEKKSYYNKKYKKAREEFTKPLNEKELVNK